MVVLVQAVAMVVDSSKLSNSNIVHFYHISHQTYVLYNNLRVWNCSEVLYNLMCFIILPIISMAPKVAAVANASSKDKIIGDEIIDFTTSDDKSTSSKNKIEKNTTEKSLIWSVKMDDSLLDAFMHELNIGNKIGGSFTTTAYENITKSLSALFGFKVDKDKVKNRWKTLKRNFSEIYDIFRGG